jgi:hypothetical protein
VLPVVKDAPPEELFRGLRATATLKGYVGAVLTKLGVDNRVQAARVAFRAGPGPLSGVHLLKLNQLTFTKSAGWPLLNVR